MSNISKVSQEFESMLYDVIMQHGIFIPVDKNTFQSKKYIVKKIASGWSIYDLTEKRILAETYLKVSAFAYCKVHEKRQSKRLAEILEEDLVFSKNYIDSIFYKKTYKVSKDPVTKDSALWRYELVHSRAKLAKEKIDRLFYSSIV